MEPKIDNSTFDSSPDVIQRYFEAIVESSDDAILTKDLNGIIRSWNGAAEKIFGYTAAEIVGKPVATLIPAGRSEEGPDILSRIRRGEKIDHYETVRQRKDGSLLTISLTVSPIKDAGGKVIGASKVARDITGHKSAEELRAHFAAIVESSDDAILSKDLNGIIRSWNAAAQKIFGYTAEEIVGKSVTMLIPPGHTNEEPEILARLRRGEKIDHYETVRQRKDGTLLNISLTVSPIRDAKGTVIGASKIARDITDQKRAAQAVYAARHELALLNQELETRVKQRTASLNEAVEQMEEFSYSVSHDLRSPARAMRAYAEALREDYGVKLDERGHEYLRRIVRSAARMDKLILDLLTYSKIARGKIEMRPIDVAPLLHDIIEQYPEMRAPKADIIINGRLPNVRGHEPSLTQVFSNLLSNSVKFVAPGIVPKVEISAERRGDMVRFWIQDNGIGISPESRARVFDMFERGGQHPRYEGTGIGLAIVRKAAERMGGGVGIEPNAKGGSLFWIELPAEAA